MEPISTRVTDRVCLITGATSGLGRAAAVGLARLGATVIVAGRDPERTKATVAAIRDLSENPEVDGLVADLASLAEVRRLAATVRDRYPRLDVLVNNAGGVFSPRALTIDGLERNFQVNYLGHFLLTRLLTDCLTAGAPARVITVASVAHRWFGLDLRDLQTARGFFPLRAYGRAKLAVVLFTYELARRLAGTGVTANCLDPGGVATNFGRASWRGAGWLFRLIAPALDPPEWTGLALIYLATAPELAGVSGRYFSNTRPARSSARSHDEATARRLWDLSAQLIGLPG